MANPVTLPPPALDGSKSFEAAIATRRSVRRFAHSTLTLEQISQLAWAAQGESARYPDGFAYRTSPSPGALYPTELYVVTAEAVSRYNSSAHALEPVQSGDMRRALQEQALDQSCVGSAPVTFVITAVMERVARKYGNRAKRYCTLEAGHVAQNILLQACAMDLVGVPVGAFNDNGVARVLGLNTRKFECLYIVPVGHPPV